MKNHAIFGEIDAWRLFVISVSKPRNFDLCCEFMRSCAVGRAFDVAQSSEICAHAVSLRVQRFRALLAARSCHLSVPRAVCMCVHVRGAVS